MGGGTRCLLAPDGSEYTESPHDRPDRRDIRGCRRQGALDEAVATGRGASRGRLFDQMYCRRDYQNWTGRCISLESEGQEGRELSALMFWLDVFMIVIFPLQLGVLL